MSFFLTLNRFHELFCCFHYWYRTSKNQVERTFDQFKTNILLNPFVPNAPFLYSLKTSENITVFRCFLGVEKERIDDKCVNMIKLRICNMFILTGPESGKKKFREPIKNIFSAILILNKNCKRLSWLRIIWSFFKRI